MNASNIYTALTQRIITEIESGNITEPRELWRNMGLQHSAPKNAHTGKSYSGCNRLLLTLAAMDKDWPHNHWMTFKQALEAGHPVRKGETGTRILYYSSHEKAGDGGESERYFFAKSFTVFNVAQLTDWVQPPEEPMNDLPFLEEADQLIAATGAYVNFGGHEAYYRASTDQITMPDAGLFSRPEDFYAVLFHELVHWTGAKHRLNRLNGAAFGSPEYAFEELVAELGAAFLCSRFMFDQLTLPSHVNYLSSWLTLLRKDDRAIFRAAAAAERAVAWIDQATAAEVAA